MLKIIKTILLSTAISTISERSSASAFQKLNDSAGSFVTLFRNGEVITLPTDDVVVGDLVILSAGDKICADGYLVSGEISLDQSALTGESKEVQKSPQKSCSKLFGQSFRQCWISVQPPAEDA